MLDLLLIATLGVLIAVFVGALLPRKEEEAAVARPAPDAGIRTGGRGNGALVWALVTGSLCALALAVTGLAALQAGAIGVLLGVVTRWLSASSRAAGTSPTRPSVAAAVDLVVASLRAGATLVENISTAAAETRACSRDPRGARRTRAARRVGPLRARRPRTPASPGRRPPRRLRPDLALRQRGKCGLVPSNVSRSIRDSTDVVRRTASQAIETQASIVGIVAITYGLAFLMWQQYPERVEGFAASVGSGLIGLSIVLGRSASPRSSA